MKESRLNKIEELKEVLELILRELMYYRSIKGNKGFNYTIELSISDLFNILDKISELSTNLNGVFSISDEMINKLKENEFGLFKDNPWDPR